MPKTPSQRDRILTELQKGTHLTRTYCISQMYILEAPARISELRRAGHDIKSRTINTRTGEVEWWIPQKDTLFDIGISSHMI